MAHTTLPLPWSALALASTRWLIARTNESSHMNEASSDTRPADAAIMRRSLRDPSAFAELFDRHHEAMWRFVWTRMGDEAVADDLAAEVFRIAFEQRHDYDPTYASAKPWLFGIAANLVRQHHRHRTRRSALRERVRAEPRHHDGPDPQARLEQLPDAPVVEALRALPARDREPLLLFAWDQLTYEEIAAALQIPLGTVRSRIHRARRRVRQRIGTIESDTTPGGTG